MSLAKNSDNKISEQEYLAGELISEVKHEYIDGTVFAMAGASENHGLISGNILSGLKSDLKQKKSPCDVFSSDMKIKISEQSSNFFYPDIVVICDKHEDDDKYYKHAPIIIIEVLSDTTRKYDKGSKKLSYFNIPSLQEYVIIEQDYAEVEVFRKSEDWKSSIYFLGDEVTFQSINITLSVEDIYYHVDNNDMNQFLKEKE